MLNWGREDQLSDDDKSDLLLFEAHLNRNLRSVSKESGDENLWYKCCEYVCINLHPLVAKDRETAVRLALSEPEWWETYLIKWTEVILTCNEDLDKVAKVLKKAGKEYLEKIDNVE